MCAEFNLKNSSKENGEAGNNTRATGKTRNLTGGKRETNMFVERLSGFLLRASPVTELITLHVVNPKDGDLRDAFKCSPRSQNSETFLYWDVL